MHDIIIWESFYFVLLSVLVYFFYVEVIRAFLLLTAHAVKVGSLLPSQMENNCALFSLLLDAIGL